MEAQTSKKQYQAIAPVSRFDLRSSAGAQTKAVDPVSRFRWGLELPGHLSWCWKGSCGPGRPRRPKEVDVLPCDLNIDA